MSNDVDPFRVMTKEAEVIVTAVLAHPLHGRLVETVIFFVRPDLEFEGQRFGLTWWSAGVAYYKAVSSQ